VLSVPVMDSFRAPHLIGLTYSGPDSYLSHL
jgi:hypothetical protein